MTTFQSARETGFPESADASSAQPHVRSNASLLTPATESRPNAVLASGDRAGRREAGGDGDVWMGVGVVRHLQAAVAQGEPVGLHGQWLARAEEMHDGFQRFAHSAALVNRVDTHHVGVGREHARAAAEHGATFCHVVELQDSVRHHQRVVVRQRSNAGAKLDPPRPGCCSGDEDERVGDEFACVAVMFADPDFVVSEVVEMLDEVHVALHRQRRVFTHPVEWRHENPELHPVWLVHRTPPRLMRPSLAE